MSSRFILLLAIVVVMTAFFEVPLLEEYPPFNISFFRGFILGFGLTLFALAYVRRKNERDEATQ